MRSFTVSHSTAPHGQPCMDAMIGVGAALASLENSTDAELAPALLQRPALTDRLRNLVGVSQRAATTQPSSATAPQTAPPATAFACLPCKALSLQRLHRHSKHRTDQTLGRSTGRSHAQPGPTSQTRTGKLKAAGRAKEAKAAACTMMTTMPGTARQRCLAMGERRLARTTGCSAWQRWRRALGEGRLARATSTACNARATARDATKHAAKCIADQMVRARQATVPQ